MSTLSRFAFVCSLFCPWALPGCNSSPTVVVPSDDAGLPDLLPAGPKPIAPVVEPATIAVDNWITATVPQQGDPVIAVIDNGTFVLPKDGDSAYNTDWGAIAPDDKQVVGSAGPGSYYYAATVVNVPDGQHLLARADVVSSIYANGTAQPGDVYGGGYARAPLFSKPGPNLVIARGYGGRGDIAVELYTTPDEVYINLADVTRPDLVLGNSDEQWLGVAIVNTTTAPAFDVVASVEESADFSATTVSYPSLAAGAYTKLAFDLKPKAKWDVAGRMVTIALRIDSPSLNFTYRKEYKIAVLDAGKTFQRSFRSAIDNSAQYYGVVAPSAFDAAKTYAMVLTLHGASVEGIGQAQSYTHKDWTWIIAPTNRRPYGFDWEEWGRLDALEVLGQAKASYKPAADQIYLTGHSMGGHGTWNIGVLFPSLFATIGPSAGWGSFYSYQNVPLPTGPYARSTASSNTQAYMSNLAERGVYVIQGTADDNVPVAEARRMVALAKMYTMDVQYHEQIGAGHWWGDASSGAACVDWAPLFDFMKAHRLDPSELTFTYTTPSTYVNATHSYVSITSQADPFKDMVLASSFKGDTVTLATTNVRGLVLDGAALKAKGIAHAIVDGKSVDVAAGAMIIGPQEGKKAGASGPFNEVFHKPFIFVYPDATNGAPATNLTYQKAAANFISTWELIGNGQALALPAAKVTDGIRANYNLIYLGVRPPAFDALGVPLSIDAASLSWNGVPYAGATALVTLVPDGGKLSGYMATTPGAESLLFHFQPFHSGLAIPDYYVYSSKGARAAGFFGPDWKLLANP